MWKLLLLSGSGGFIGTSLRFLINRFFQIHYSQSFPAATFIINIIGCLLFGFISGLMEKSGWINPKVNALLIVGFCGGFTTFSTFSFESYSMFNEGKGILSFLYIIASVIIGIIGIWAGLAIARR